MLGWRGMVLSPAERSGPGYLPPFVLWTEWQQPGAPSGRWSRGRPASAQACREDFCVPAQVSAWRTQLQVGSLPSFGCSVQSGIVQISYLPPCLRRDARHPRSGQLGGRAASQTGNCKWRSCKWEMTFCRAAGPSETLLSISGPDHESPMSILDTNGWREPC